MLSLTGVLPLRQAPVPLRDDDSLARIRGRSRPMRALLAKLARAAESEASVLVTGETGTGKDLLARAIHDLSPRASGPFEIVDCGALTPALMGPALFGEDLPGAFERADGGTLLLDQVRELSPEVQAALLGVIERQRFRRAGGGTEVQVDVRIVCTTNSDLSAAVRSGAFRRDLFYRIAVVTLEVPPLRDRIEDIPILVEHFLRACGFQGEVQDLISGERMESLRTRPWPGNVRELENFVEALLATGDPQGEEADLSITKATFPSMPLAALLEHSYKDARRVLLTDFERLYFEDALKKANGNVSKASRASRINRTYLIQILRKHGLR